jgi:hypothetical protein
MVFSLYPFYALALMALSFLMPAPLFVWFAPDVTRKELTDFVGAGGVVVIVRQRVRPEVAGPMTSSGGRSSNRR